MTRRAVGCYEVIWDGPKIEQIDKSNLQWDTVGSVS